MQPPNDFDLDFDRDVVLAIIAQTIEESHESSISITLTTGGTVITGALVSSRQWFENQQQFLQNADPNLSGIAESFAQLADLHRPISPIEDIGTAPIGPDYLHLIDAAICVPEFLNARQGWRIHIGSISAWALGGFNKS